MNNQQAINLLKNLEQSLDDYCELNDEGKTAFRMAITALELFGNSEQLPSAQPKPCEDAVSRHRLLNDLEELTTAWEKYPVMAEQIKGVEVAIGYVKSIPSVQPETHEERTETHACDLISRAMLLEYIHNEPVGKMLCDKYNLDGVIKQLPSAQPEIIRCKDCKQWKDSDGVYRRGVDAESKCPLNIQEVYAGTFYCGYAERRTDEQTDRH